MSKLTENVAIVAGTGVARGVGMPALYGGAEVLEGNERYASMLNAQEYGNHLPQFWRYCRELAAQVGELNPSHVHQGLAERGYTIITQNIGGMHAKAGSENVIEINGNIFTARCMRCSHSWAFPLESYQDLGGVEVPPCPSCGKERTRPDVVLPQEKKRHKRAMEKLLDNATAIVYLGVDPGMDNGAMDTLYTRVPYSLLVSENPWGNFTKVFTGSTVQWAEAGFPIH